jgi:hypothetical protein
MIDSDTGVKINVGAGGGTDCTRSRAVLTERGSFAQRYIDHILQITSAGSGGRTELMCRLQHNICKSIDRQAQSSECSGVYAGCQSALRHLHTMMFASPPEDLQWADSSQTPGLPHVCNNFARKGIRGFFHGATGPTPPTVGFESACNTRFGSI